MSRTMLRRHLTAGLLAAVLTLAGAVPAQARDLGPAPAERAWQWLQDVWTKGVLALWELAPEGRQMEDRQTIDPNGATAPEQESGSGDFGPGIDPNG